MTNPTDPSLIEDLAELANLTTVPRPTGPVTFGWLNTPDEP